MATFYFNAAVDNEWQTLGNWWMDDNFTTQATALPTSVDDVIATASITSNSGSEPTVANFTFNDPNGNGPLISISITVNGDATFNDSSYNNGGTVTGDATFNDSSFNYGTVTGDATFNDSSFNYGTVTGNATFNDSSTNNGTVTGNATFNDTSLNSGTVNGDAVFNDSSSNFYSTVNGDAVFNDSSSNSGTVNGDATFSLSAASNQIAAGWSGSYGSVSFAYEKGINGSSILGVI